MADRASMLDLLNSIEDLLIGLCADVQIGIKDIGRLASDTDQSTCPDTHESLAQAQPGSASCVIMKHESSNFEVMEQHLSACAAVYHIRSRL